jgi:hypothetical protein
MPFATPDPALDIATLLLAVVTAAAAVAAVCAVRAANRATRSAVDSAQKQVAAEIRPVLADVPQDLFDDDAAEDWKRRVLVPPYTDVLAISAPIRNVGLGPAFLDSAGIVPANRSKRPEFDVLVPAFPTHRVLPAGEATIITCSIRRDDLRFRALDEAVGAQFNILVRYTDLAGEQRQVTNLYVVPSSPDDRTRHITMGVEVTSYDDQWMEIGAQVVARLPLQAPQPPPEPGDGRMSAADRVYGPIEDALRVAQQQSDTAWAAGERVIERQRGTMARLDTEPWLEMFAGHWRRSVGARTEQPHQGDLEPDSNL